MEEIYESPQQSIHILFEGRQSHSNKTFVSVWNVLYCTVLYYPFLSYSSIVSCVHLVPDMVSILLIYSFYIASLLFFPPVLIHSTLDWTLRVALSAHLITLLVIALVFIAIIKPFHLAAVAFSLSSTSYILIEQRCATGL